MSRTSANLGAGAKRADFAPASPTRVGRSRRRRRMQTLRVVLVLTALVVGLVAPIRNSQQAWAAVDKTVTLNLSDASYTYSAQPAQTHAGATSLYVTKSQYRSFVKFDTSKLGAGARVTGATLRLFSKNINKVQAGLEVHPVGSGWTKATLTANNRPAPDSRVLNTLVLPTANTWTSIPLTNLSTISASGTTSFELGYKYPNPNYWVAIGANSPQLVLTYQLAATSAPATSTRFLPINLPATSTHTKLVFAHYFPPFPISLDNAAPAVDYYTRNYLKPTGENGKWSAAGGLVRDRPIPQSPIAGDYRLLNIETEVRQAKAGGIDGFALDVLNSHGSNWDAAIDVMQAAHAVDPNFKVVVTLDMGGAFKTASAATIASALAALAAYPAAWRNSSGHFVVSAALADYRTVAWWSSVLGLLKSQYGITPAFLPLLLNAPKNLTTYAPISWGLSEWGVRNPWDALARVNFAAMAHKLGKVWMAPVAVQDERPYSGVYDEAGNTETLRRTWYRAIGDSADFAEMLTWNDYSESTSFAPSINHGYNFLDINSYYMTQFQTGAKAPIVRDVMYVTHRNQMHAAKPSYTAEIPMVKRQSAPSRDTIEILTFLTAPATVTVKIGPNTYSYSAPGGVDAQLYPLAYGRISASASRSGNLIGTVNSPITVTSAAYTADLEYFASGSLRPNPPRV